MVQQHGNNQNIFEHYGTGDFRMLGFYPRWESETLPLFDFPERAEEEMRSQPLLSLPRELYALASERHVSVDVVRKLLTNRTAARFTDFDKVLTTLASEKELEILDSSGKQRSRSVRKLRPTDQIALPSTLLMPGFSRHS